MRPVPAIASAFVARHEGLRLRAYKDPAGVWTIGYGHTGPTVTEGLAWTRAQCSAVLEEDLRIAASRLAVVVKREVIDDLTDNQYAALLSFVFNLGATKSWTIWKRLNARRFDEIPAQMMRFVNVGDRKVQGLVNRRAAEVALWSTDEPGSVNEPAPPSSVTRMASTPPASMAAPVTQSKSFMSAAAAGVTTGGVAVAEISKAVSPYAQQSEIVGRLVAGLALAAAILAAAGVVFLWLKNRQAAR